MMKQAKLAVLGVMSPEMFEDMKAQTLKITKIVADDLASIGLDIIININLNYTQVYFITLFDYAQVKH